MEALGDGEPLPLGGGRRKAVLAALLLRAGEPVRPERLLDEIWGDTRPSQNTLHVHVSQLRKQLGDALRHDAAGYVLDVDDGALDVQRFERLLAQARGAADHAQAVSLLDDALALWRGPALADAELDGVWQRNANAWKSCAWARSRPASTRCSQPAGTPSS